MKLDYGFVLLIFGMMLISGCIQQENQTIDTPTTQDTPEEQESIGETKEFYITAKQWEFKPSTIEVSEGDNVILHVESVDVTHGIGLPDFGVSETLEPGETVDIEFVADKTGTFTFVCNVFCGTGHGGMTGQLIVNPQQ